MRQRSFPVLALLAEAAASAIDAFQSSTWRTMLAVAAVSTSVCAVLVAGAASTGLETRLARDAEADGARGFVVYAWPGRRGIPLGTADAHAIAALPEISGASAHLAIALPVSAGGRVMPDVAVDAFDDAAPLLDDADLLRGRWLTAAERSEGTPVAVIDDRLAAHARLASPALGANIEIGHQPFRVVGVFHGADVSSRAIIPLEASRRVLGLPGTWTDVTVRARREVPIQAAMAAVRAVLRRSAGAAPGFIVAGTARLHAGTALVPLLGGLTTASLAALGVSTAGMAVLALAMMAVRDRRREIGLRKVLGATRSAILFQLLVESAMLATLGGALGLAAGRVIAALVAGATSIPAAVSSAAALTAVGLTLAGGAILAAGPAVQAAKLDVLRALGEDSYVDLTAG